MNDFLARYRKRTPQSAKLFRRAKKVQPGGVSHNVHFFPPYPLFIKGAEGSRLMDADGNEYIDLWMGHYTHILGHHPKTIIKAVERQLKQGFHWGFVFEKQVEWAEIVHKLIPSAEMVRFCCSGTEATMYATRLARAYTGKKTILKIAGGWHGGNSDLYTAVKWPYEREEGLGQWPELQQYTRMIPFNDVAGSLKIIRQTEEDLAGIILEPVIGEGGFNPATTEYLKMLQAETQRLKALLIFDEVISGFRLSLGGAQKRFKITPDLTTLGKIAGGGFPVGAVVGRKDILEMTSPERKVNKWEKILIGGGTFSSHPFTAAAGTAMLHYLKDHQREVYPVLEAKGKRLREGVQQMFDRHGVRAVVTGIGSLFQTCFPIDETPGSILNSPHAINQLTDVDKREVEFRIRMLNHGVHVVHGGGAVSIAHSDEDIEKVIDVVGIVAKEMAG